MQLVNQTNGTQSDASVNPKPAPEPKPAPKEEEEDIDVIDAGEEDGIE